MQMKCRNADRFDSAPPERRVRARIASSSHATRARCRVWPRPRRYSDLPMSARTDDQRRARRARRDPDPFDALAGEAGQLPDLPDLRDLTETRPARTPLTHQTHQSPAGARGFPPLLKLRRTAEALAEAGQPRVPAPPERLASVGVTAARCRRPASSAA